MENKLQPLEWRNEKRKVKDLVPYEFNPRKLSEEKKQLLINSIEKFNLAEVPAINLDNVIIAGHQRIKVLMEIGRGDEDIDVRVPNRLLTDQEYKEYNITSNVPVGFWDVDVLDEHFEDIDLEALGLMIDDGKVVFDDYDNQSGNAKVLEAKEDDFDIPDEITTDIVLGDLFEIGRHRLLCGDSTCSDTVAKLMNGEKGDMAHNDPPYGMKKEKDGVLNDNLNYNDLLNFNFNWIPLQFSFLKENGSWYCWGIDEPLMDIYSEIIKPFIKDKKATFRNLITWDKGNGQSQNSDLTRSYATADEKCLFIALGLMGSTINACDYNGEFDKILNYLKEEEEKSGLDKKEMKRILGENMYSHYMTSSQFTLISESKYKKLQNITGFFNIKHSELKKWFESAKIEIKNKQFYFNNTHDNMNNVWHFSRHKREGNEGGHATPKPIPLCERAIKSSCKEGGIVLDFFLGSGSTMVACEQLNRRCYGMELDPKYCQVIVDRMIKLNPDIEVKRNGIPYVKAE